MKPVPFAEYLARQQQPPARPRVEPVAWPKQSDSAPEGAPRQRNSPLLRKIQGAAEAPRPANVARIDQSRHLAFEEGRDAARKEMEEERAKLREEVAAEVAAAREQWIADEGQRLAAAHRAALDDFEMRCAQSVANILRPFLTNQIIGAVTDSLVQNLEVLFAARTEALFEISGPKHMLDALAEKFEARGVVAQFTENDSMDIRVRAGDTVIETQLGQWMQAIGALPGDAPHE